MSWLALIVLRKSTLNFVKYAAPFLGAVLFLTGATKTSLHKIIEEAENLSLVHNRVQATGILIRAIKSSSPNDRKTIQKKITQLATYFYTDKGLQAHQVSLGLVEKGLFAEAADKLSEVDDFEKGNTLLLNLLSISQLQTKKVTLAIQSAERAEKTDPFDLDIQRDLLASYVASKNWVQATKIGDKLAAESQDKEAQTQKDLAVAYYFSKQQERALKFIEKAHKEDPQHPEIIYWVLKLKSPVMDPIAGWKRYLELCREPKPGKYLRESQLCEAISEAKNQLLLLERPSSL